MARKDEVMEGLGYFFIARGVVSVIFGIMALVWPAATALTIATLFTIWLFANGVINIVQAIRNINRGGIGWIFTLLLGAVEISIGAYLIQRPALKLATFIALIAISLIIEGIISILIPLLEDKKVGKSEKIITMFYGVTSLIAGIVIWRYPIEGGLAFLWVLGLFALITGPLWISLGLELKEQ